MADLQPHLQMWVPKRKHVTLELDQKLEILEKLKKGCSQRAVAAEYNVGRATVYDIKMKENELRQFYTSQMASKVGKRRVMRKGDNDLLDAAIYKWFLQQHSRGLPVSGPKIKAKAAVFNKELCGSFRFASSEGWLSNWKKRLGVRHLTVTGESFSASEKYPEEFEKMVEEEELSPAAVYNADETDLSFKMLPSKILDAHGCKQPKGRITLMACCNADGTHKLPLLLIGKSQRPPCFQHVQMRTLPVDYHAQKNAWMNSEIFSRWFHDTFVPSVKKQLTQMKLPLRAILLIDNAPGHHPSDKALVSGDIRAVFLPPNVTASIQPMDQGILDTVKRNYRRSLLSCMLLECENQSIEALLRAWKAINMRDVVFQTAESWDIVDRTTIVDSWRKVWPSLYTELVDSGATNIYEPESSIADDSALVDMLRGLPGGEVDEEEVAKWVTGENNEDDQCLTDEEIIKSVQEEMDESDEEDVEVAAKVSHAKGAQAADVFLRYIMQQPDTRSSDVMVVKRLLDKACYQQASSLNQNKIPEVFQRNG